MKPPSVPPKGALAAALLLGASAYLALKPRPVPHEPPPPLTPGLAPAALSLSAFERKVLMNLDALSENSGAAGFSAGLDAEPGLRPALANNPSPAQLARFQELVRHFASDPAFLRALEYAGQAPAGGAAKDCADPASKPAPRSRSLPEGSRHDGPAGLDDAPGTIEPKTPGCADVETPAPELFPGQNSGKTTP